MLPTKSSGAGQDLLADLTFGRVPYMKQCSILCMTTNTIWEIVCQENIGLESGWTVSAASAAA